MSHIILKYPIHPSGMQIYLPHGSKILSVQIQKGTPQMWILQNKEGDLLEARNFKVFCTGEPFDIENIKEYIGTFQLEQGAFIGHLFEVKELSNDQ